MRHQLALTLGVCGVLLGLAGLTIASFQDSGMSLVVAALITIMSSAVIIRAMASIRGAR